MTQRNSSEQGYESTAHHLLNRWADINLHEPQTKKLHYIKQNKNGTKKHCTNFYWKKGEDINSCGSKKDTPLQNANKRGHKSITQLLLDKETDTSSCKENKESPLHIACKKGHEHFVFFLFDQGADIKFFDNKKQTPLHIAGYSGNNSNMHI